MQRIREAEREQIFNKYSEQENEIVTGLVQRVEKRNVFIDLDKTEAILPPGEQMPGERYRVNNRLKVYITEVKRTTKGPQITVSRSHPGLVKRLFELEVPEIAEGEVLIKNISREAGSRTKISVYAEDPNIDPVGSCVCPESCQGSECFAFLIGKIRHGHCTGQSIVTCHWEGRTKRQTGCQVDRLED
jgi:N utilization substance protein A